MSAIAISQSGALAPDTGKARAGAASIFELLDQKSTIDSSDDSGMVLENIKGDIQFQNVSFKYPSRPDVQILRDLCLTIHSGKVITKHPFSQLILQTKHSYLTNKISRQLLLLEKVVVESRPSFLCCNDFMIQIQVRSH